MSRVGGFPKPKKAIWGGSRGPEGVARLRGFARLRGCTVVRESLLYYCELIEGVARIARFCATVN